MMNVIAQDFDWLADATLMTDATGREHVVSIAKATFHIEPNGACCPAAPAERHGFTYADEHYGEPGSTSIKVPAGFSLAKQLVDVVISGAAWADGRALATKVDVQIEVAERKKSLRVFGDRVWERSLFGRPRLSDPVPFEQMPIVYERAFGGSSERGSFLPNPIGVGYYPEGTRTALGNRVPNIECPERLIEDPQDCPDPIGLGAFGRNFQERAAFAGTYDQKWRAEQFPLLPHDFDPRYFQHAAPDLQFANLVGGERMRLRNMTQDGVLDFILPRVGVPMQHRYANKTIDVPARLDSVLIYPTERLCVLLVRGVAPLQDKPTRLHEIRVGQPSRGRRRAEETDREYLDWRAR